jgi:hypothetical protein
MRFTVRIIFLILLFTTSWALCQQGTRLIYLVRNAETSAQTPDSPLTPAGERRAACLASTMKEAGIKQIYVNDAKSAQQTANALATQLKITPVVIPAKDPNTLIRDLMYAGGGNILVVANADTLPFVVARLKAGTIPPLAAGEYNRLLITTVIEGGATQVSTLRYCDEGSHATETPKPAAKKKTSSPVPSKKP